MQRLMPLFCAVLLLLSGINATFAQTIKSATVKMDPISPIGSLYATIDGKEYKVSDSALHYWIIEDGKGIIFSAPGSLEESNDVGQGLYYAATSDILKASKILETITDDTTAKTAQKQLQEANLLPHGLYASSFRVDTVIEATSHAGKTALLVSLTDKADIPRFVVVSPEGGKLSFWERARLASYKDNKLIVNYFQRQGKAKMGANDKPLFVRTFDLDDVLRNGVKP